MLNAPVTDAGPLVRDLDEGALLAQIFPLLPTGAATIVGPGDDAALVAAPDGRFVVSTDVLVEDRHFRRDWSSGEDVGRRAAAQNLADIAAMGARPTSLVAALVVPGDLPVTWVTGLARGLAEVCTPLGAAVVGGDLSGGHDITVAVTVHGDLAGRDPVLRSGARPGDVVAHSGVLGWSAAGLALLASGVSPGAVVTDEGSAAVERAMAGYRTPAPPFEDGPAAASAGATSMLDVSDGLLRDAGRVARASGVAIDLDATALAPGNALRTVAALVVASAPDGEDDQAVGAGRAEAESAGTAPVEELALRWVLTGGEDHGLLATFPAGTALPAGFRAIGVVSASPAGCVTVNGTTPAVDGTGWDHFHGR